MLRNIKYQISMKAYFVNLSSKKDTLSLLSKYQRNESESDVDIFIQTKKKFFTLKKKKEVIF